MVGACGAATHCCTSPLGLSDVLHRATWNSSRTGERERACSIRLHLHMRHVRSTGVHDLRGACPTGCPTVVPRRYMMSHNVPRSHS